MRPKEGEMMHDCNGLSDSEIRASALRMLTDERIEARDPALYEALEAWRALLLAPRTDDEGYAVLTVPEGAVHRLVYRHHVLCAGFGFIAYPRELRSFGGVK
jgi:hypothetical protein